MKTFIRRLWRENNIISADYCKLFWDTLETQAKIYFHIVHYGDHVMSHKPMMADVFIGMKSPVISNFCI